MAIDTGKKDVIISSRTSYKIILAIVGLTLLLCSCSSVGSYTESPSGGNAQSEAWERNFFEVDFLKLYNGKLAELKEMYDKYASIESYVECSFQFLEIPDGWYSCEFIYGYDIMPASEREKYLDMSVAGECYPVTSIQISLNCFDLFDIAVAQGRGLTIEDMSYFEGATMPVLVGSDYAKYMDLGDTFVGDYLLKRFTFCVVGILTDESNITINGETVKLDSCVIMPSFSCENAPNSENENLFQVRHYVNKLTGLYPSSATSKIQRLNRELEQRGIGVMAPIA